MTAVINRAKRAHGHFGKVIAMEKLFLGLA